jgi:hypothetical protein
MKINNIIFVYLYGIYADIIWTLSWYYNIGNKEKSSASWVKAQKLKANWLAEYVFKYSGWHGLNCFLYNEPYVIELKPVEEHTKQILEEQKHYNKEISKLKSRISELSSLVDGAYDVVELYKVDTPYNIKWKNSKMPLVAVRKP